MASSNGLRDRDAGMGHRTVGQQLTQGALTTARALGLPKALHRFSRRLPHGARLWIGDRRTNARIRAGDAGGLLPYFKVLVPEQELKRVLDDALTLLAARRGDADPGDYLEFGVYVGTSLSCMHEVLAARELDDVRLFGFDSFEGLPSDTDADETSQIIPWRPGDMKVPYEVTRENLDRKGVDWDRTTLIKGFFEDSLTPDVVHEHRIRKVEVIMVDCDLYSSTKTVLDFCAPLIGDHAVILFDDWCPATLAAARTGERRAFEEFLAANPDLAAEELESYAPELSKVFLLSRV